MRNKSLLLKRKAAQKAVTHKLSIKSPKMYKNIADLKKFINSRPDARPRPSAGGAGGRSFGDKPADGDRAAYRRAPGAGNGDKAGAAGPGSAPMEFVSELFYYMQYGPIKNSGIENH